MRHGKKINHLSRKPGHRKALLKNMAISLIMEKRIFTTVAKAKALRPYVEPLLTRGKNPTQHNIRIVFSYLQSKEAIQELFGHVGPKIMDRPGGYTRILRTGNRLGDNAELCMIELVDYNEAMLQGTQTKTRRSRKKKGGATEAQAPEASGEAAAETASETQE